MSPTSATTIVHGAFPAKEKEMSPPRKRPRFRREEESKDANNGACDMNNEHAKNFPVDDEDAKSETSKDIVPKDDVANVATGAVAVAGAVDVVTLISDDEDDVVEVVDDDVEEVQIVSVTETRRPSLTRKRVVDLTHQPEPGLYFAVVRGLVGGESWSGVTNCMDCAYSSVRYSPRGAASYVTIMRRDKDAMEVVQNECDPAHVSVHSERSVVPELLDVLMYTDGCGLDEKSGIVKKIWANLRSGSPKFWTGYGVWFAEDCPYNSCGMVPGEQNVARAELYALCVGLETVVEHIDWAGRVLVRSDAALQDARETSSRYAKDPDKYTAAADIDLWRRVEKSMLALEARGTIVIFEWVKGHARSYGNMSADKLAKAGGIAMLSAAEPFAVEAGIQWGRYRPKPYHVPERFRSISSRYAIPKRNVAWHGRKECIESWAQRKRGLTWEPCLDIEPHPALVNRKWGWCMLQP